MNNKKVIIIGAGIAGLSAGCYLQMNGYDTEIFEANGIAGGLCTGWNRNGYNIEGCIHGLLGSSITHPLYKLWNELIDMKLIKFIDFDIKHSYNFADGQKFVEYANLDKLEKSMKEIGPEDESVIEEFIKDTKRIQTIELSYEKPKEFLDLPGKLKFLKSVLLLPVIKKWVNLSAEEFSCCFKNPLLRDVVKHFSSPILFEMFVLSEMDLKRCGYPKAGSLEFAKLFERKYITCGGNIRFKARVNKILTKDNKAEGIKLDNGEEYLADIIISAADGKKTVFEMLEGKFVNKKMVNEYIKVDLNTSKIQISLGINRAFKDMPHTIKMILGSPFKISDGNRYDSFDVMIYNDELGLLPVNKTLMTIQLDTKNSEYWTELRKQNKQRYMEEKFVIANGIIDILERRLGKIKGNIDMTDVTTPATYIRYTGNWNGSAQGWANENIFKPNPFKKMLPGLKSFYMAGQWVEPGGGVPAAFKSGRDVAQIICRKYGAKFKAT